jgi:diaminopimelate dehydrogenase
MQVEDVNTLLDMGHGVHMTAKAFRGKTQNQQLEFSMRINNPALTAQLLGLWPEPA